MLRKALLLTFLCISMTVYADDQNWTTNSIKWKTSPGVSWSVASQTKYKSWDYSDGLYIKNWVFGSSFKLKNGWSIGLAYKQELAQKSDGNDILERRPFLDVSWKKGLGIRSAFDFRLRTEVRKFDAGLKPDEYRFRFRFRLTGKQSVLGHPVEPYLAIEPFYDTTSDSFNKYRLYTGLMVPAFRHAKIRLGYILEDARNGSPHHVFATGLSLSF